MKTWISALLLMGLTAGLVVWAFLPIRPTRPELEHFDDAGTGQQTTSAIPASAGSHINGGAEAAAATLSPGASNLIWNRFRGPNGCGISSEKGIPTTWSDTNNLAWKTRLPGPGASSPVLTAQWVIVTCYSGYGEPDNRGGNTRDLQRHLCLIDRKNGNLRWSQIVENTLTEDPYSGNGLPEHGYATNTPTTDGETIFTFFGKSGVMAFDFEGKRLWQTSVGTDSGNRGWGSASSLVLYNDWVIVNASEESHAIIALNKSTGAEVWKAESSILELAYGTPAITQTSDGRDLIVIAVPGEIWALNPANGKLTWFAETSLTGNLSPSVIVAGKRVFAFGGYLSSGSVALGIDGKGDVSQSEKIWNAKSSSYVATPVLIDDRFYWIDDKGYYYATDANTGAEIVRERVPDLQRGGRPIYASPVAIDDKLYFQTRLSGTIVMEPGDEMKILSINTFASDKTVFNATPAVDAGQLFLRSDSHLYCVAAEPGQ